jgi:putative hydrolase of the HAD superfamily
MTWVLFDYGGVLCHPQPERDLALMAGVAGCTVAELEAAYWPSRLAYDRADFDVTGYWQRVAGELGRPLDTAQIAELSRLDTGSWLSLQEASVDLVGALARAGYRLALLSNAPADVARAVQALPLAASFEHLLFSCFLKLVKPDPECFRAALAVLGAGPGEVVFLDDRPENVAAAARLGIRSARFTGAAQARADLAAYGVTPG